MKVLFFTLLLFVLKACQTKDLEKSIEKIATENNFSGTILIAINDSIIINNAYGYSDKKMKFRNTPLTVFPIASITKLFVKQSILLLADSQKLSLNDTLSKYCDFFSFSNSITISDLLYHKSGITDIHNRISRFNQPNELQDSISSTELFKLIDSFQQLEFEPGSQISYSNSNYLILAYIIEKLTNKPLDVYLKETIFQPYKMLNTGLFNFYYPEKGHTAGFYSRNNIVYYVPYFNFRNFWGSGNAFSTTQDLFKYYQTTQKLLKPEIAYQLVQHSGYYIGFRSYYKVIPEIGLAIIVLSNNGDFNMDLIVDETIKYVKEKLLMKTNKNSERNKLYVGIYFATRNGNEMTIEVSQENNELKINNTRLIQIASNKFLMDNPSLTSVSFYLNNDTPELIMNDNGEILFFTRNE